MICDHCTLVRLVGPADECKNKGRPSHVSYCPSHARDRSLTQGSNSFFPLLSERLLMRLSICVCWSVWCTGRFRLRRCRA